MTELDFTIEFNGEGLGDDLEAALFAEADSRLRELAKDHDDMVGAAVTVRRPAHGETSYLYEVTVVAYIRPEHMAATKKDSDPAAALNEALDAIERQVRKKRAKLRQRWERPGNDPVITEIAEVAAAEEELP